MSPRQKWQLVTAPTTEPVPVQEIKEQVRLGSITVDDQWIANAVQTARASIEFGWDLKLLTQTWDVFLDWFPRDPLCFLHGPVQSITDVFYTPNGDSEQTVSNTLYTLDAKDNRDKPVLYRTRDATWPSDVLQSVNGVRVRLVAGFGDDPATVPTQVRTAIRFLVSHWYQHREPITMDGTPQELPKTLGYLRRQVMLSGVG